MKINTSTTKYWQDGNGKTIVNLIGGSVGGVATGIATGQIIKAQNKKKFTQAEQEWMDQVGSHLHCYVGSDAVGDYGDTVSVTLQ